MFDRRQDAPEAILRVGQVVQHTNAKSEVKDTRLERQVMNIALDDMAIFGFDGVVSRYLDPLAEVETHHFCPRLLRAVKKSSLATTDVGAHFALEKISFVIALPNTLMNRSGSSVGPLAAYYRIKPNSIIIIHDDADIALGSGKLSFDKRSAGHKGVESVIRALKTKAFWRIRIGIAGTRDIPAEKLVLKKFTPAEALALRRISKKSIEALIVAVTQSPEMAMNEYNR